MRLLVFRVPGAFGLWCGGGRKGDELRLHTHHNRRLEYVSSPIEKAYKMWKFIQSSCALFLAAFPSPLCGFSHSRFHSISLIRISIYRLIFIISSRCSFSPALSFVCFFSFRELLRWWWFRRAFRYSFHAHLAAPIQIFFAPPSPHRRRYKRIKKINFFLCRCMCLYSNASQWMPFIVE